MKKLLVVFFVILVVCVGCVKEEKVTVIDDKVFPEEMEDDLFFEYYLKASKLMDDMTLEEKVGQVFLVRYDASTSTKQITNYHAGGFVLFAKDFENHTKTTIKSELDARQKSSKVPLALAVDEEGGYVTRVSRFPAFRSERFKSNRDLFETGGYDLVKISEKEKAELLLGLGLNLNLAPVADVSTNSNDYINIRTFGRGANETAIFISNIVSYNNEAGISSSLKHFPGYGNNKDTHYGGAIDNRSYDNFIKNDFLPF